MNAAILNARRMSVRYRFPDGSGSARRRERLDGVLREAAGRGALEAALMRAGFDSSEIVCVRRVDSRVHLRLGDSDASMAELWGAALAESIRVAADRGAPSNVVRYRSRAHALRDLVLSALRRDLARAWAWRQIDLWPRGLAENSAAVAEGIGFALEAEPRLIAPVLGEVARAGLLETLARECDLPATWRRWARLAWQAVTGHPFPGVNRTAKPGHGGAPGRLEEEAPSILAGSELFVALLRLAAAHRVAGPAQEALIEAWAALALLDHSPAAAASVAAASARTAAPAHSLLTELAAQLEHAASEPGPAVSAQADPSAASRQAASQADAEDRRAPAASLFGGLLYLLNLIEEPGLLDEFLREDWPMSVASTLHQLALTLAPGIAPDDPAALAFAGLSPSSRPPLRPALAREEAPRFDKWRVMLIELLEARLDRTPLRGEALLRFVCNRPCVILADPGWIEVRLRLEDVSVDIRRARLDLNPGYLPWLGLTVVFVYE